jgi:methionyl-tRNA synthetase
MNSVKGGWSDNARTMTDSWMREGLKKRCITRDLKWGIPVPLKGFEDKVFYSWFDAPIGYIGITAQCRKDWKEWWHNPSNVKLVQFMGKDNIPFHTILFPAFLIGARDNYTLMSSISVNEFLNYEGGQFSKSRNVGVFGDDAISTGLSPDVFRYYIMINRPERNDSDFSWDDFLKKNNSELVANLGNLVNRTMVFLNKSFGSILPTPSLNDSDKKFLEDINSVEQNILMLADSVSLKEALKEVMHLSRMGNQYLQDNEPWKNPSQERKNTCLFVLTNLVKDLSILVEPFMPSASKSIRQQLGINKTLNADDLGILSLPEGHKVNDAALLFRKIEEKEINSFREKFSGAKEEQKKAYLKEHVKKVLKENVKADLNEHTCPKDDDALFERLQLRVARITDAKKHSDAAKLYVEEIDLGDEKRQIVSGLAPYYSIDELIGRKIIVVTNLEPARIRGVESQGMLLAAEENGVVGLLGSDDEIGSYVYSGSAENTSDAEKSCASVKNKITIKDFAAIDLRVIEGKVYCNSKELKTRSGFLNVDRIKNGKVS